MTRHIFAVVSFAMILLCVSDACGQSRRGSGRGYDRRDEDRRDSSSRDGRSSNDGSRKRYRFKTAHERLPKGIPDWFVEKDANHDGQVMMAEFAVRWNDALVAEFVQFDRNGDGVITPKECMAAREAGAVHSGDGAPAAPASKSSPDAASPPVVAEDSKPSTSDAADSTPSQTAASPSPKKVEEVEESEPETPSATPDIKVPEAYLKHAVSYIGMYDTDGNGALTSDEWEKMRKSPQDADRDGDGRVTPQEFALSIMKR
jgi:hypothetical protein